jgi:hypothetical protein
MTLQSKLKKLIEHPEGVLDILSGVNPNHTYSILYAKRILGKK